MGKLCLNSKKCYASLFHSYSKDFFSQKYQCYFHFVGLQHNQCYNWFNSNFMKHNNYRIYWFFTSDISSSKFLVAYQYIEGKYLNISISILFGSFIPHGTFNKRKYWILVIFSLNRSLCVYVCYKNFLHLCNPLI